MTLNHSFQSTPNGATDPPPCDVEECGEPAEGLKYGSPRCADHLFNPPLNALATLKRHSAEYQQLLRQVQAILGCGEITDGDIAEELVELRLMSEFNSNTSDDGVVLCINISDPLTSQVSQLNSFDIAVKYGDDLKEMGINFVRILRTDGGEL